MDDIEHSLRDLQKALPAHPVYERMVSPHAVRSFMEFHVFAVWDFMSLVKSLAARLTCTEVPWVPTGDPVERRFIHEIVLDEESDLDEAGEPASHFELYRRAMESAGADFRPIDCFIEQLQGGAKVDAALSRSNAPDAVRRFVSTTLRLAGGSDVEVAAAFAYGRELIIPPMFSEMIAKLAGSDAERWRPFAFYLERHIACDEESHGPIARQLVERLCGGDEARRTQASTAARTALQARIELWDAVAQAIDDS